MQSNVVRAAAKGDNATLIDAFKRLDQMDPLLLEEKVFNARDRNGWTVFQLAAANGYPCRSVFLTSTRTDFIYANPGTQTQSSFSWQHLREWERIKRMKASSLLSPLVFAIK